MSSLLCLYTHQIVKVAQANDTVFRLVLTLTYELKRCGDAMVLQPHALWWTRHQINAQTVTIGEHFRPSR